MPVIFLPFGEWLPTVEHGKHLLRCENVIPSFLGLGLRSLPKLVVDGGQYTDPVAPETLYIHHYPTGSGSATYVPDAPSEFYGSSDKIWTHASGAFTDISRVAAYSANPSAWHFASFGNDVWAVNYVDVPQRRTNNTGDFADGCTGAFIPQGRFIAPVRVFMVTAALSNGGRFEDEFAWSDDNDATNYNPGAATTAGSGRVVSRAGQITGLVGGEYGRIFKRSSMHSLIFTGGSDIFQLDEISGMIGTPMPGSIVECRDGHIYFWGGDSFYRQTGTGAPEAVMPEVSAMLLDREGVLGDAALRAQAPGSMIEEDVFMWGIDVPELGQIWWLYRGLSDDADAGKTKIIVYSPKTGMSSLLNFSTTATRIYAGASYRNMWSSTTTYPQSLILLVKSGANADRAVFTSATQYAFTFATARFGIAQEGSKDEFRRVRIRAIQPVFATNAATQSPDYRLAAVEPTMTIRVVAANDPNFQQENDSASTQISPRSDLLTMSDKVDGWLKTNNLEGRSFLLQVTCPESTVPMRSFPGLWVDFEELS